MKGKMLSCSIPSVPPLTRVSIRLTSKILPDFEAFGLGTFWPCGFFAVFEFPWIADIFVLCAVAGLQPHLEETRPLLAPLFRGSNTPVRLASMPVTMALVTPEDRRDTSMILFAAAPTVSSVCLRESVTVGILSPKFLIYVALLKGR
jgi:hypothetical protein